MSDNAIFTTLDDETQKVVPFLVPKRNVLSVTVDPISYEALVEVGGMYLRVLESFEKVCEMLDTEPDESLSTVIKEFEQNPMSATVDLVEDLVGGLMDGLSND